MPTVTTLPVDAALSEILEVLERDGAVIVENFLSSKTIQEMNELLKPYITASNLNEVKEGAPDGFGDGEGELLVGNTYRIYGLLGKMPEQITEVLRHPIWNGIAKHFLSDDKTEFLDTEEISLKSAYQMSLAQSFTIMPGCKRQKLHRDHITHGFQPQTDSIYTSIVTCGIAGTKTTFKNGATQVAVGSHLWPKGRFAQPEEIAYAEMEVGSAAFWLGSTLHGGGANTSTEMDEDYIRQLFAVVAVRDWVRQEENQFWSTPWDVIRKLPADVLSIAGFGQSSGGSGFVDGQDPKNFLNKLPRMEVKELV